MTMTAFALDSEPTLADILRDLWRANLYLAIGAAAGFLCALAFLIVAVPQYRASMLVAPTTRSGTPDISALFPNNASFAMEYVMQSFGPGDSSDFMRFEAILREPSVSERLLSDERIAAGMAGAKILVFSRPRPPATAAQMAQWLQKNLVVEPVSQTRLKRVSLRHPDPDFAVYVLGRIYGAADSLIRAELAEKTERRTGYLRDTIDRTAHPEHRRVLTQLLMDQEQISMVLAVGEPFAAQMAEPPAASAKPVWPRRALVLPAFVLAGMFAGYFIYMLRRARPAP